MMVTNTYLETGRAFVHLLDVNKDYNAAAQMLSCDFEFVSPKFNAKDKGDWLTNFPTVHKDGPIFEELTEGDHDLQVVRKGTKKIGFVNISLKEILEFNEAGEIMSITAARN